ncbi:MAG: hypothetical protein HPY71_10495 [Firmicutes bacterium]|nr:hypothetical protein [Bacillota bacterium]
MPKEAKFTPPLLDIFKAKTGSDDPATYFNMEMREVYFKPPRETADFSKYYDEVPPMPNNPGWEIGEWGVGQIPGSEYHFIHIVHPMTKLRSVKELEEYPFPDIMADYRHAHLDAEVERYKNQGLAVIGYMEWTIFEIAWHMRGMDRLFEDIAFNPDFATVLLEKITEIRCQMARRYAESGVDIIRVGDDIGTQRGMLMSPKMWREWFKPRLLRVIESAKKVNPRVFISYHSDGYIEPVIPDLIEIGVNILNPIQPECMSIANLKRRYGRDLSFWGGIGTQTTMPFGTPDEVRFKVREAIEILGAGGGYVIAPTHVLEPDVPWENILAFFEAVEGTKL